MGGAISDPISLDAMIRIIAGGNSGGVGSSLWAGAIRSLLRILTELGGVSVSGDVISFRDLEGSRADAARQATNWLIGAMDAAPEQFNAIFEEVGVELGLIDTTLGQEVLDLGQILAGLSASGNTELQDIIRDIEQTVEQTRTEITDITTTGETTITEQRDVFVDVPTPEEVLDDFRTGVATYAENLFSSGAIDQNTRRFLLDNPNVLLGPYLGALGQLADAGENIFEIVGTDFELIPIEQIGERIGPELVQEINSTIERIESGELTIEELTQRVQDELFSGTEDPDQQREIQETINEIFTQHGTTTTTEETVTNLLQLTTERIFQRPNLATVFSLSPLDFLRERFTGQSLVQLAGTLPGRQQFQRQFAGGVRPSGARRLG